MTFDVDGARFNTYALYGLMLSDQALFGEKLQKRADDLPLVRRSYAQEPAKHTRYESEEVRRDACLSPAEKRNRLDQLTRERNGLLMAAVQESKAAQKEKEK